MIRSVNQLHLCTFVVLITGSLAVPTLDQQYAGQLNNTSHSIMEESTQSVGVASNNTASESRVAEDSGSSSLVSDSAYDEITSAEYGSADDYVLPNMPPDNENRDEAVGVREVTTLKNEIPSSASEADERNTSAEDNNNIPLAPSVSIASDKEQSIIPPIKHFEIVNNSIGSPPYISDGHDVGPTRSNGLLNKVKREDASSAGSVGQSAGTYKVVTIPTNFAPRKPGQASLVIVFDGTGSMENCLIQLRSGAKLIIEKFARSDVNPIYNYVFVPFRDPDAGPSLVTTDHEELFEALDNLKLGGGGDCPESSLTGILAALNLALPKSYVYIFTDATATDYKKDSQVLELVRKKQTPLTFLLTGFCNSKDTEGYKVFERLASASNGQVYNLREQDISEVINDIKNSLDKKRVALKYMDSPVAETHSFDISIDETLKEFSVSVAGLHPNITILDPHKNNYLDGKSLLNLENLKVLNVQNPIPGDWNIVAGSDSSHSVRLTALSDVMFNFGFSLHEPNSIGDTLFNPLRGENNIFTIAASDTTLINNLTAIRITLYYDNEPSVLKREKAISFKLDLHPIRRNRTSGDDTESLYATKPFEPPRRAFKIEISGFDKYGNPLQRLLSTIVQSTDESAPEVFLDSSTIDGRQMENITLKCVAQSLVPMTVQWKRGDEVLRVSDVEQSTTFTYDIVNADPHQSGRYTCHAKNRKGFAESFVNVKVRPHDLRVQMKNRKYSATEHDPVVSIECEISPKDALVEWSFNEAPLQCHPTPPSAPADDPGVAATNQNDGYECRDNSLRVWNVTRHHAGRYRCHGRTAYESKFAEASLAVLRPARLRDPHYQSLPAPYGDFLQLTCDADGIPVPSVSWTFQRWHGEPTMVETNSSTVRVDSLRPEHEGIYICTASNGVGEAAHRTIRVYGVASEPPLIHPPPSSIIEAPVGSDVLLTCACSHCEPLTAHSWSSAARLTASLSANNPTTANMHLDIDRPWSGNDQTTHSSSSSTSSVRDEPRNYAEFVLAITNVTAENEGAYQCRLSNEHSTADGVDSAMAAAENNPSVMEVYVRVLVPALVEHIAVAGAVPAGNDGFDGTAVVVRGNSISILCKVSGTPAATVRWSKDGAMLLTENNNRLSTLNGTLLMPATMDEDEGEYVCEAANSLGTSTKRIYVRVVVPPQLTTHIGHSTSDKPPVFESIEGHHVQLPCSVVGRPEPTVSWFIDGQRLDITNSKYVSSNNTLGFRANGLDSGIYECRATNEFGTVAQQSTLLIYGVRPSSSGSSHEAENNAIVEVRSIDHDDGGGSTRTICRDTGYELLNGDADAEDTSSLHAKTEQILLCENALFLNNGSYTTHVLVKSLERNSSTSRPVLSIINDHYPTYDCQQISSEDIPHTSLPGTYECAPKPLSDHITPRTLAVRVIKPPQLVQSRNSSDALTYDPHKQIRLNTSFELICPYENHAKLNWLKDNQPLATTIDDDKTTTTIPETSASAAATTQRPGRPHWRPDGRLWFERVDWSGAGNYTCLVENEAGRANFTYRLDVIAAPGRIVAIDRRAAGIVVPRKDDADDDEEEAVDDFGREDESSELTVAAGEKVLEVDCVVLGNPTPTIKWLHKDQLISDDKLLRIRNPGIDDSGAYTCWAQNSLGTASRSYQLTVTSEPKYAVGDDSDTEHVMEQNVGDRLVLNCTMLASPEPRYEWSKNGLPVPVYDPTLVIDHVDTSHAALYKCTASNAFGQQQVTFDVSVVASPTVRLGIDSDNGTIAIKTHIEPGPLELRCFASGAPTPIVSWTLNGRTLLTTARVHDDLLTSGDKVIHLDAHGNSLVDDSADEPHRMNQSLAAAPRRERVRFGRVETETESVGGVSISLVMVIGAGGKKKVSGDYACTAINAIGRDEKLVRLNILEPPKFRLSGAQLAADASSVGNATQPPTTQIATLAGQPVILSCLATGRPQPQLYWFRGDTNLSANTSANIRIMNAGKMLTLLQTSARDSGVYTCLAKSPAGEGSTRFNVSVLEPPAILRKPTPLTVLGDNRSAAHEHGVDNDEDITEEIIVKQGDSVQLHCPVSGRPLPAVTWLRLHYGSDGDGRDYREERVQHGAATVETNQLDIPSIDEPATFMCYANSSLGEIKLLFHIILNRPPAFDGPSTSNVVRNGDTPADEAAVHRLTVKLSHGFTLECPVLGEPEPNVTWYMNDEILPPDSDENVFISSNGHILRVNSASRDDAGQYMCMASNSLGIITRSFDIKINVTVHWSPWSGWDKCNAPCGRGSRRRSRRCLLANGKPTESDDVQCEGPDSQEEPCQIFPCPINGHWSEWDLWSECSNSCIEDNDIESVRQRFRRCDSPVPRFGGRECAGRDHQTEVCDVPYCPVAGRWSNWDDWSACSEECGNGTRVRRRSCDNPEPAHGGPYCEGSDTETDRCFVKSCAVHGGWSDWSKWSPCSQTCGRGQKYRKRDCTSPKPANGGRVCAGSSYEMKLCRLSPCRNDALVRSSKNHYSPYMTIVNPVTLERSQQREYDDSSETLSEDTATNWEHDELDETNAGVRQATVTVTQDIPIVDDMVQMTIHRSNGLGPLTIMNPSRTCDTGLELVQSRCLDVNECSRNHGCSHECINTHGSYRCSCPGQMVLSADGFTCMAPIRSPRIGNTHRNVVPAKYSAYDEECHVGYELRDGLCRDTNECLDDSHGCSSAQTCLNTKGSYLCIPRPCPLPYRRDDSTSTQCVQRCSTQPARRCSDGARIGQTLSYKVVTVPSIDPDVPIVKLVSYDLDRQPLDQTEFAFADRHSGDEFVLDSSPRRPGVVLVYAKETVHREKLYTILIGAQTFSDDGVLLYVTKYVVYVYVG